MADKTKDRRRVEPTLKVHRKMLDLTTNPDSRDMLVDMLVKSARRVVSLQEELDKVMMQYVVEGIIEPANSQLSQGQQAMSLVLHSSDGRYKVTARQKIHRYFDDNALIAAALISEVIAEHQTTEVDDVDTWGWLLDMLGKLFFNAHNKKQFKWSPELHMFLTMPDQRFPDDRLIKARDVLNGALHTERGKWYWEFFEYDGKSNEYQPLDSTSSPQVG